MQTPGSSFQRTTGRKLDGRASDRQAARLSAKGCRAGGVVKRLGRLCGRVNASRAGQRLSIISLMRMA